MIASAWMVFLLVGGGLLLSAPASRRMRRADGRDGRHRPDRTLHAPDETVVPLDDAPDVPRNPMRLGVILAVGLTALGAVTFGPAGAAVGLVLGVVATLGLVMSARRSPIVRPDPIAVALLLDLIGAVLASGAPPDAALLAVADAAAEEHVATAAQPLRRVGRLLMLGADPDLAWGELARVPGYEDAAAAARRCATSGARLAAALQRSAATLRADRQSEMAAASERVGVWSLLPLGLCFLPAFACLGVLPVVIGVAADVLPGGLH